MLHAKNFVIENGKMKSAAMGTGFLNYGLIFENLRKYGLGIPIILEGADDVTGTIGLQKLEKRYT